jgi:D-alanyl-D-alanine endopeptidase (penicillin-binding protein 7)
MKKSLFLPLKLVQAVAFSAVMSVAGTALLTAALSMPIDARAATSSAAEDTGQSTPASKAVRPAKTAKSAKNVKSARPVKTVRTVKAVAARGAETHRTARPSGKNAAAAEATARRVQASATVEPDGRHRVSAHFEGRGHRQSMRSVAFAPSRPVQAFSLQGDGTLSLRSSIAYVVDQNSGETLYDKNSSSVVPIASITKLMTSLVVLESKAPMSEMLTVTDDDRDYEKGTGSRLSIGSTLSREDMLHIALMASENRAAAALSRYYPGGRPAFLMAMNRKAEELGMHDTHFESPTGLTSHNVSSARDLVKLVDAVYKYPLIRQFSTDHSYDVNTGKRILAYRSTNALIRSPSWDIGLQKTGFINEAGECLVMQATIHNRPVVIVLLDSYGKYSRFGDAQRLRDWLDAGGVQSVTSAATGRAGT